jgi:hypothetical protein
MRRLGFLLAAALLMLAFAAPVAARERVRESGTFNYFSSISSTCSGNTCTDTVLDVFPTSLDTIVVCLNEYTYNSRTGRLISQQGGCTPAMPASVLTISSALSVRLAPTDVTFQNCNQRRCTEGDTVTVSASDQASGPTTTVTGRVTIKDGTCTTKITFSDRFADVSGTMTVDGTTLAEQGSATVSNQTSTTSCR